MSPKRLLLAAFACAGLLALLGGRPAAAIPPVMIASGQLLDSSGNPVRYMQTSQGGQVEVSASLAAKVLLYDSASAAQPFATLDATATAFNAYFNIPFNLPDSALARDSLWYSLMIDVGRDGLTGDDAFPDRFQIGVVPYAMATMPVTFYTTFGGFTQTTRTFGKLEAGKMLVVPFETPPGGVEFNQMNVYVSSSSPGGAFSFAIYDEAGKKVVGSDLITKVAGVSSFLQVKHQKITLPPARLYYVGVASTYVEGANTNNPFFPNGSKPVAPILGRIDLGGVVTGQIPPSFDPAKIEPDVQTIALPVTLRLVSEAAMGKTGWSPAKPGHTQYRWVPVKPSGAAGAGPLN